MSPLFMDTGCEPNSPGSLSAEESHNNTAESEREGEGQQTGRRVTKRQEKNRDAARRSRRKQTERADELHEELQCLERSNSLLQKEIAALKKEFHLYTTALEHHEPFCCLQDTTSGSVTTTNREVSPSVDCQVGSRPPGVPLQVSASIQAAAPPLSTSLTPSPGLQTLNCFKSDLSSSAPVPTTASLASCSSSSLQPFTTSSSVTVPRSVSLSTVPSPHSLFYKSHPSQITPRLTNVLPVCTSFVSNPAASSSLTTAAQPQSRQDPISKSPSMPANACVSRPQPDALKASLMKQASFLKAPSNVAPLFSQVVSENAGFVEHGCPMPQPPSCLFRENPINSNPLHPSLPSTLQDSVHQSLSASHKANQEPSPASCFASKPSYSQHAEPGPVSLLSLLTVPAPPPVSQTTSSIFSVPPSQPPPSLPLSGDPSGDMSFSELLEVNEWILQ